VLARVSWQRLAAVGLAAGVLGWAIAAFMLRRGVTPVSVSAATLAVLLIASAGVLWFGWAVHEYKARRRPGLDPIRAVRTAMAAQAAAIAGSLLGGGYLGYAVGLARDWGHTPRRDVVVSVLLAAVAAAVLLGAGKVSERWCRADNDDDDPAKRADDLGAASAAA